MFIIQCIYSASSGYLNFSYPNSTLVIQTSISNEETMHLKYLNASSQGIGDVYCEAM